MILKQITWASIYLPKEDNRRPFAPMRNIKKQRDRIWTKSAIQIGHHIMRYCCAFAALSQRFCSAFAEMRRFEKNDIPIVRLIGNEADAAQACRVWVVPKESRITLHANINNDIKWRPDRAWLDKESHSWPGPACGKALAVLGVISYMQFLEILHLLNALLNFGRLKFPQSSLIWYCKKSNRNINKY